jgi:hypothetical protein
MAPPSHKVSGAVNHGHVHHGSLPIFQRGITFCVVNPELICVVFVQIIPMQQKKPMPLGVVPLLIIQSTGYPTPTAGRTSTDIGVTTSEFAAIGLPHQTIVTPACLGNTPTS